MVGTWPSLELGSRMAVGKCGFAILVALILSAKSFAAPPVPLLAPDHPVKWWFVFKFNAAKFVGCSGGATRSCPFGGTVQNYVYGQQFVYASDESDAQEGANVLQEGSGCVGSVRDPVGATVEQIYHGQYHYVVWNDQFYGDPAIAGCSTNCASPWGHSKGTLAWDDDGNGVVLHVSTPSWLGSASANHPRKSDGNSLGCVKDDNVKVSQHFFALKLNKAEVVMVLKALQNASVATDIADPQVVSNGGPGDIQDLVRTLGRKSSSQEISDYPLSFGVRLIGKPSALHVPPWQLVSSKLGGMALRTATWWAPPRIPTTTANAGITCWSTGLQAAGPVQIATSGKWAGVEFGLKGGPTADNNHAKIGVSLNESKGLAIFGDLNQQGALSGGKCDSSQNGRGGLFFVVSSPKLANGIGELIGGATAPSASAQ
jgi:hypothetical protein